MSLCNESHYHVTPLLLLLLLLLLLPDTLPPSWQQQTKRAGFSGLRRGRSAFDLCPLRRGESGGSQAKRKVVEEGKHTPGSLDYEEKETPRAKTIKTHAGPPEARTALVGYV
ncbi:hypothetical protein PAMP_003573 [Pampus punctatissimus]